RKGITPVLASVLLIILAVAAAGTLYTVVNQIIGQSSINNDVFNQQNMNVENCWKNSTRVNIAIRNSGGAAINASEIDLLLNAQPVDDVRYYVTQSIVDPEDTYVFSIDRNAYVQGDRIKLVLSGNEIVADCFFD
ncbi:MAG: archaellin/type IV pilin N-terminal domain-containing protein, partial [Candidatus Nanohaloarchaea archaeon]